jgi:hypothetical protein
MTAALAAWVAAYVTGAYLSFSYQGDGPVHLSALVMALGRYRCTVTSMRELNKATVEQRRSSGRPRAEGRDQLRAQ